jgi:amino acid adenylation domain-containing protein
VQVIAPFEEWRLRVFDLFGAAKSDRWNEAIHQATKEAQRPFDLTQGPLLRAAAWQIDVNDYLFVLVMHHIVSDGWSLGVFANELKTLYKAYSEGRPSPLPELSIQYSDFVHWQRERLASKAAAEQLDYWKRQLAGHLPALVLPGEHLRRPAPAVRVAAASCTLHSQLIERLKEFSYTSGVTPFMTLLAVFQILLHRYTGLDDVLVGTPVAGRTRVETETLIGLFANTLVLRTNLSGNPTFLELLAQVRETTLEAHAQQDVPFEMLVEALQPERDLTSTPLFQVMIVFDPPLPEVDLPGLQLEQIDLAGAAPKFDLILFLKQRDGELIARFEYNTARLDHETVQRLARHFHTLLVNALAHAETHISDLELMTKAEEQHLLNDWNDTYKEYPRDICLHQLFEAQAARTPELAALVAGRERLSYRELNQRANRLAHHLRALGAGPESLVGVLLNRSTSLVVALLGVLKAGAAYVPLDPDYPRERLRLMIDANINVLVTQENLKHNLPAHNAGVICLDAEWGGIALESSENPECLNTPSQLAYLIYTSGSTGKPKAAAIEHRNVVTLMHWARELFTTTELEGVLASTSVCFDLSVFEIFVPLCWGGKVILAANALELPTLNAASEVTLINTVPSAMTELIRMSGVPKSVRTVNLAGEALHHSLVQRIYELESVERVLNLYGPSEDTTYSTGATIERCDSHAPTIGRPIANTQAYILDIHQRALPIGVSGELYVAGDGLARGYFNRPDLTAEKFIPNPFAAVPGMRMYRTGDLARYLSDGQIEFLGRSDHQVKLRGFRIELGEIETMLREHPAIHDAVVVLHQQNEDQVLVAYVVNESEQTATPKKLKAYLSKRLPKHMVPAFIVPLAALPLTPNGKIDRRALPSLETSDEVQENAIVLPRTDVESRLAGLWSQLLKRRQIGVYDDFFAHGGHSLLAVQLISRIREEFQVDLPLRRVFETSTIAELARLVENASLLSSPIPRVERSKTSPLSFAQQRLWFLDRLAPGSSTYNIFGGIRLRGELDQTAFAQSLNAIVERHEILRTVFTTVDGRPAQVVSAAQPVSLSFIDLLGATEDERETKLRTLANDELSRPFNLSDGPLLRLILLRLNEEEHVALVTMHHIVADGWSMNIFVKEFAAFYRAFHTGQPAQLEPLPIQYADYAHWQRAWFDDERLEIQLDYWRRTLAGTLPVLELPVDHARPSKPTLRGEKLVQKFSAELSEKLRELGRREGATLFMVLLAAFKTLLYRYTNQDDLIVGTAVAGRNRAELEGLIGIFINMLVLRTNVSGNPTFVELLRRVREVMLEAYAHQDVPFERLVEKLQPDRTLASPFFQVAFGLQHERVQNFTLPGLELSPVSFDTDLARYDLTLWVFENESELEASWTFSKDLFRPETIELMNLRFQTLLFSIVKEPELRLSELEMHSDEERRRVATRERESEALSVSKLLSVKRRAVRVGAAN